MNLPVFLCLLAGHLAGDFLLQTGAMVANKRRLAVQLGHAALVTGVSWLWCGRWSLWGAMLLLGLSHAVLDGFKIRLGRPGLCWFVVDQGAHLAVLAVLAAVVVPDGVLPYGMGRVPGFLPLTVVVAGGLLAVRFGGFLIGEAVRPLLAQVDEAGGPRVPGLAGADRLIGQLERALILLLVLVDQPGGVGWLLAAKGLLRFGEVKETGQRREAEYILIGTLMSFGWALLVAFGTRQVLRLL